MKKAIEGIPFLLLCSLTPFFFFTEPNLAQSLIVAAIAGLSGYRYYLDSIKQPDYVRIFTKELDQLKKENKAFRDEYGKMSMMQGSKPKAKETFGW